MGSRRVGYDWATSLSLFTFMHWRRKWQPTPVFLPGESQGRESLVGCRLWGRVAQSWTRLKRLSSSSSGPRTENFQMYKKDLEKAEKPEIKLPTFAGSQRKQGNFRKLSTSASLTMWKPVTMWFTTNCGKSLKRWEYQTILLSLEKPVFRSRSNRTRHGTTD